MYGLYSYFHGPGDQQGSNDPYFDTDYRRYYSTFRNGHSHGGILDSPDVADYVQSQFEQFRRTEHLQREGRMMAQRLSEIEEASARRQEARRAYRQHYSTSSSARDPYAYQRANAPRYPWSEQPQPQQQQQYYHRPQQPTYYFYQPRHASQQYQSFQQPSQPTMQQPQQQQYYYYHNIPQTQPGQSYYYQQQQQPYPSRPLSADMHRRPSARQRTHSFNGYSRPRHNSASSSSSRRPWDVPRPEESPPQIPEVYTPNGTFESGPPEMMAQEEAKRRARAAAGSGGGTAGYRFPSSTGYQGPPFSGQQQAVPDSPPFS